MSIAIRGMAASHSASGSADIDVTLPSGHAEFDVLLMIVANADGADPFATPTDWFKLDRTDQSFYLGEEVFWRIDNGSLGASVYLSSSQSFAHPVVAVSVALSGASQTLPTAAQYAAAIGFGTTILFGALGSWSSVNGIDLAIAALEQDPQTPAAPAGYTLGTSSTFEDASTWITIGTAYKSLSGVTTVGGLSSNWGSADPYVSHHIFITEPAGAGPVGSVQAIVA